jgi:hypothetical protein
MDAVFPRCQSMLESLIHGYSGLDGEISLLSTWSKAFILLYQANAAIS